MTTQSETVTLKEAAARIGVSPSTAYTLAKMDKFPVRTVRVGHKILVPIADLDRFLGKEDSK